MEDKSNETFLNNSNTITKSCEKLFYNCFAIIFVEYYGNHYNEQL